MLPYSPAEVLTVVDTRDASTVAVFTRITEDHWAKPGALMMYSLAAIEEDLAEYHRIQRFLLT